MSLNLLLVAFLFPVIVRTVPQSLHTDGNTDTQHLLFGKQTEGVLKKVLESQFMDAVARIDEYIKFLFELNAKLKSLSTQLAVSGQNITEIESILVRFTKACQMDMRNYLESHKESLLKHPLKTLAESVADALSLTTLGQAKAPVLTNVILDQLGLRFATLYKIAQENVSMLQAEIRAHIATLTRLLSPVIQNLTTKPFAEFNRLQSMILQLIHHSSN